MEETNAVGVVEACLNGRWSEIEALGEQLTECRDDKARGVFRRLIEDRQPNSQHAVTQMLGRPSIRQFLPEDEVRWGLHTAAKADREDLVEAFQLSKYNLPDAKGRTPVHIAVHSGSHGFLQALLKKEAVYYQLRSYWKAEKFGKEELSEGLVRALPKGGIRLTPVSLAVIKGCAHCLDCLVEHNEIHKWKSILAEHVEGIGTLFHLAITFGKRDMVKHLLSKHWSQTHLLIDRSDPFGKTPMAVAAALGDDTSIQLLHLHGGSIFKTDHKDRAPLHHAVAAGKDKAISLLIAYGAKLSHIDHSGKRAQDYAPNAGITELLRSAEIQKSVDHASVPDFTKNSAQNLVFQGGGVKGIAYYGVIRVLHAIKALDEVERVAGSSAGAITAMFLSVGCQLEDFKELIVNKSFADFKDPVSLWHVLKDGGRYQGEAMRLWLETVVSEKTGIEHCTFGELNKLVTERIEERIFKHLHTFIQGREGHPPVLIQVSSEDPKWKDLIISDAVRASAGFPVAFRPHVLHFKDTDGVRYAKPELGTFIDGGVDANLPMIAFDKKLYTCNTRPSSNDKGRVAFNRRSLGFSLSAAPKSDARFRRAHRTSLLQVVKDLAKAVVSAQDVMREFQEYNRYRVVHIGSADVKTLDFDLSQQRKLSVILAGIEDTCKFLKVEDELLEKLKLEARDTFGGELQE
jgi:NTE family protein